MDKFPKLFPNNNDVVICFFKNKPFLDSIWRGEMKSS